MSWKRKKALSETPEAALEQTNDFYVSFTGYNLQQLTKAVYNEKAKMIRHGKCS